MPRRTLLASFVILPFVRAARSLDLVKVIVRYDGKERIWWEPRAMAEKRFANVIALLHSPRRG